MTLDRRQFLAAGGALAVAGWPMRASAQNIEVAKIYCGSPATGSPNHFLGALLAKESGIDLRHVPYRGSAPGIQDLLGGQVGAFSGPVGDFMPHMKSGKLRMLATSGPARSKFAPDVATYAEQGFKDLVITEWYGFFLPAKASPA